MNGLKSQLPLMDYTKAEGSSTCGIWLGSQPKLVPKLGK